MRLLLPLALLSGCLSSAVSDAAIAHNARGAKELAEARLDDAEARFRLALELAPRFAEAHANLGMVLARRGDAEGALAELRAAIAIDPDLAAAHADRGAVLASIGRLSEAIDAYEAALGVQPEMPEPRRNLVQLLIVSDRLREARAHALRLVQLEPEREATVATLAYCELGLGRPDAALARIDEAIAVPRPAPALELVRALALAARGESEAALAALGGLVSDPAIGEAARLRRAALLLDLGRVADTRIALAESRRLGDDEEACAAIEASLAGRRTNAAESQRIPGRQRLAIEVPPRVP